MAYQTGSATSHSHLLQQLAAWLVTQGWTQNGSFADGTAWRAHLNKGGWFLHLRTQITDTPFGFINNNPTGPSMAIYMSGEYAGAGLAYNRSRLLAPMAGDGEVCGGGIAINSGANHAYHFFHDDLDHYTIVVERDPGIELVFGFGLTVTKHGGAWTGNPYFHAGSCLGNTTASTLTAMRSMCPFHYGSWDWLGGYNSSYVRANIDSFVNNWLSVGPSSTARTGWTGRRAFSTVRGYSSGSAGNPEVPDITMPTEIPHTDALVGVSVSTMNNQALLIPIRIYAVPSEGGARLLCTIPAVFQCNAVGQGFLSKAEIQLGGDTYMLFPRFAVRKVG